MEIPNLFVYACHFVEPNNDIVKNALNGAIITFITTLRTMPYTELAKHAPKAYFSELINTVVSKEYFLRSPNWLGQIVPLHNFDPEATNQQWKDSRIFTFPNWDHQVSSWWNGWKYHVFLQECSRRLYLLSYRTHQLSEISREVFGCRRKRKQEILF